MRRLRKMAHCMGGDCADCSAPFLRVPSLPMTPSTFSWVKNVFAQFREAYRFFLLDGVVSKYVLSARNLPRYVPCGCVAMPNSLFPTHISVAFYLIRGRNVLRKWAKWIRRDAANRIAIGDSSRVSLYTRGKSPGEMRYAATFRSRLVCTRLRLESRFL